VDRDPVAARNDWAGSISPLGCSSDLLRHRHAKLRLLSTVAICSSDNDAAAQREPLKQDSTEGQRAAGPRGGTGASAATNAISYSGGAVSVLAGAPPCAHGGNVAAALQGYLPRFRGRCFVGDLLRRVQSQDVANEPLASVSCTHGR